MEPLKHAGQARWLFKHFFVLHEQMRRLHHHDPPQQQQQQQQAVYMKMRGELIKTGVALKATQK